MKGISAPSLSTRPNERCVKKVMYYFSDFMQYEPEFEYTDTVLISSGINDLCRKRMLPREICDIVIPQLKRLMNLTIKFTTPSETTMLTRKDKNLHTIT